MSINNLTALPPALQNAVQQNYLAREYKQALVSVLAYSRQSANQIIPAQIGATYKFTKLGELDATAVALNPADITNLEDGLSTDSMSDEQYEYVLKNYAKTFDIDLVAQRVVIKQFVTDIVQKQGRQAARMRENVAKFKLWNSYSMGNTVVTNTGGNPSATTCHVDDITGLRKIMLDGNWEGVSTGSGMQLQVQDLSNNSIVLQITGVTPDSTSLTPWTDSANVSSRKTTGGVSGQIIYQEVETAPSVGDVLKTANASMVLRPNGKQSTQALQPGDLFSTMLAMQGKQQLHSRGVLPYEDGFYRCIIAPSTMTQLFADPDFKQASTGQMNSSEFYMGRIVRYQGVEFVETTEAITQPTGVGATGALTQVAVNRPILMGRGAITRGDFKGLEEFVAEQQAASQVHDMHIFDGVAWALRSPLDRLGRIVASSFEMILDYCTPTDMTSTPQFIPTTDFAAHKLAILFECAA